MALLRYSAITSLDGYVNDAEGGFSWAAPSDELHEVVNAQEREVGTYLLGRRMYETMRYWETAPGDVPGPMGEFARIWRAADKVVYSTSLERRHDRAHPAGSVVRRCRRRGAQGLERARRQHRRPDPRG